MWLQEIAKIINKNYNSELIDSNALNTQLHLLIKNNETDSAENLLFRFPDLVNFANIDDETPIAMSTILATLQELDVAPILAPKNCTIVFRIVKYQTL